MPTDPTVLPVPENHPTRFVLSDGAMENGGPSTLLQVWVDMAPERGWVSLKAHLVFWNTVAVCLRRVGANDDTAITLARTIEAAMETPMATFKCTAPENG